MPLPVAKNWPQVERYLVQERKLPVSPAVADSAKRALAGVEKILPKNFPAEIHESISKGILRRLKRI